MDDPIDDLVEEADDLPDGPAKLALLEEAVRLADARGDAERAFDLREDRLMWVALISGRPELMLVHFSWCLSWCDREPARFDEGRLLVAYRDWVINELRSSPRITRPQIAGALDDMEARFRRAGLSPRVVHRERCLTASFLGDLGEAAAQWERWQSAPFRPEHSFDPAYERDEEVNYLLDNAGDAAGVAHAEPILAGRLKAPIVPHGTLGRLLVPLLRVGRPDEAVECQRRGYRLVRRDPGFVETVARHVVFLAGTGNLDAAVRMAEKHWPWMTASHDPMYVFMYRLAAWFVCGRLLERGTAALKWRLPADTPGRRGDGTADVAELGAWLGGLVRATADAFDARNGNGHFTRMTFGKLDELAAMRADVPVGPRGG